METGVKTLVRSEGGFGGVGGTGDAAGAGVLCTGAGGESADLSAWNICVKLPGLPVAGAAAGGAGIGGCKGGSGVALFTGADSARSSDESRSSSSGGCAGWAVILPNIPVALVDSLAEDSPGPEKLELSNGDLDESMLCTPRL